MIRSIISTVMMIGVSVTACNHQNDSNSQTKKVYTKTTQHKDDMKNLISIVEIPATNFSKAVSFYQAILDVKIEEVDMEGVQMGVFPTDGKTVNVVLVSGDDYKPSMDGTIVYLNAGDDLQITLDKIDKNGGKVVVAKTEISPEMGYFAMFTDTEGNKVGLHSPH